MSVGPSAFQETGARSKRRRARSSRAMGARAVCRRPSRRDDVTLIGDGWTFKAAAGWIVQNRSRGAQHDCPLTGGLCLDWWVRWIWSRDRVSAMAFTTGLPGKRRGHRRPGSRQGVPPEGIVAAAQSLPGALLAFELPRCRPLPRATPNVYNAYEPGCLIDREEHAVNVRAAAVVEDSHWLLRVQALRRYPASFWKLLQRKDRPLQTVEPRCALAWRSIGDPEVQLLELSFGGLGELNAVCHVCVEAG